MQVDQTNSATSGAIQERDPANKESELDLSQKDRPAAPKTQNQAGELLFDEDRLRIYYNKIFPYKLMFKWLSYNKLV